MAVKHLMKAVATAGTQVQLSTTDLFVLAATLQVENDNTGTIVIGGPTVSVTDYGALLPVPVIGSLSPSMAIARPDKGNLNLKEVWIDASVNGDGVSVLYIEAAQQGAGLPKT